VLRLTTDQRTALFRHAEDAYPRECCGILLGRCSGDGAVIEEIRPTTNAAATHDGSRYAIPSEEVLAAERDPRSRDLDVVGYYHSHPDAPPRPSALDREHAWPLYGYVIVGVAAGRATAISCWSIDEPGEELRERHVEIAPAPTAPGDLAR